MNLEDGFQIDEPHVFVPWGISTDDLRHLIGPTLRDVTNGYFTLPVRALGGLRCELGFHLTNERGLHSRDGRLTLLEFFRTSYDNPRASFDDFQTHFEQAFGSPTATSPQKEGFPSHEWRLRGATIVHYVFDRFGPEEHMHVIRSERGLSRH